MASEQTFTAGDLRSAAQEYKRDSDHKHKRAPNATWAAKAGWHSPPMPATLNHSRSPPKASPAHKLIDEHRAEHRAKMTRRHEMVEGHTDSSCDEDVVEPSAAPEPDAEITYSFDASRGPNHGSQVLGQALAKAVERYESKVTDKIVKDEYEVLDSDGEPVHLSLRKKSTSKFPAAPEEDDYEFV